MLKEYKHKDVAWVDLENPTEDELRQIIQSYNIDPEIAEKLRTPSPKSEMIFEGNYSFFSLHFPIARKSQAKDKTDDEKRFGPIQEVDFILSKDFLITTSYENIDALHEFSKVFEVDSILDKSGITKHAGYVFVYMILYLYKSLSNQILGLRDQMEWIEKNIFSNKEKEMVPEISKLSRSLLYFEEAISHHKDILDKFFVSSERMFEKDFRAFLENVLVKYWGVKEMILSSKRHLEDLRSTNDSLLSTKQNRIMTALTIIMVSTLPLSLLADILQSVQIGALSNNDQLQTPTILFMTLALVFISAIILKIRKWI